MPETQIHIDFGNILSIVGKYFQLDNLVQCANLNIEYICICFICY